ncbi:uncharacterized protein LOC126818312 [Patella vulgata]|uniref:uncharacterized protein LOC126818312 n=1 Tax=Patella vulgata TaxID=6465 RepID=UPI0024A984E5|nr:uncharacterized protein LOC126818312 [Patella vulgata]
MEIQQTCLSQTITIENTNKTFSTGAAVTKKKTGKNAINRRRSADSLFALEDSITLCRVKPEPAMHSELLSSKFSNNELATRCDLKTDQTIVEKDIKVTEQSYKLPMRQCANPPQLSYSLQTKKKRTNGNETKIIDSESNSLKCERNVSPKLLSDLKHVQKELPIPITPRNKNIKQSTKKHKNNSSNSNKNNSRKKNKRKNSVNGSKTVDTTYQGEFNSECMNCGAKYKSSNRCVRNGCSDCVDNTSKMKRSTKKQTKTSVKKKNCVHSKEIKSRRNKKNPDILENDTEIHELNSMKAKRISDEVLDLPKLVHRKKLKSGSCDSDQSSVKLDPSNLNSCVSAVTANSIKVENPHELITCSGKIDVPDARTSRKSKKRSMSSDDVVLRKRSKNSFSELLDASPKQSIKGENVFDDDQLSQKVGTEFSEDDSDDSNFMSHSNVSLSEFDPNLEEDSCEKYSSDDDLPEFLPQTNGILYSPKVDDFVWVKLRRYPFWPSKILDVKKVKNKVRLFVMFYGHDRNQKFPLMYQKGNVLPFSTTRTDDFIKSGKNQNDKKLQQVFDVAFDEIKSELTQRALMSTPTPTEKKSFDFSDSFDSSLPSFTEDTQVDSFKTGNKSSQTKYRRLSLDAKVTPKMKETYSKQLEKLKERNETLIKFIQTDKVKERLRGIYEGKIPSVRHSEYHTSSSQKEIHYEYLEDDNQISVVLDTLTEWYKVVTGQSYFSLRYISDVWYPEAIVFSLMKLRKYPQKKAWEAYYKPRKTSRIGQIIEHQEMLGKGESLESRLAKLKPPPKNSP